MYFRFFLLLEKQLLFPLLFANKVAVNIELREDEEAYFQDRNCYEDL